MANKICPGCKVRNAEYLKRAKKWLCRECALVVGLLVPCQGEAHSNPHIDNCGVCMPRWGVHEIRNVEEIDAEIARLEGVLASDEAWRISKGYKLTESWSESAIWYGNQISQLRHEQLERAALQKVHFVNRRPCRDGEVFRAAVIPGRYGYLELPR